MDEELLVVFEEQIVARPFLFLLGHDDWAVQQQGCKSIGSWES